MDKNDSGAAARTGRSERPITVRDFADKKQKGEKLVMMTAYDALFGRLVDDGGQFGEAIPWDTHLWLSCGR